MTKVETKAFAYYRTSSAANVGEGKDSEERQRRAVAEYAKGAGISIEGEYYDAAVSGADPVYDRLGFSAMLQKLLSNGVRTIIVESPDRFARDLMVQLAGHDRLKAQGIMLIAASAPTFFLEDTPTARLVRQVLGAVAEFEKATTVAKLAAARKRKRQATGKCEGRKSYAEKRPEMAGMVTRMRKDGMTLAAIADHLASQGYTTGKGTPIETGQVSRILSQRMAH